MAQEQEYKYPNVCGPQAPWSGEAGRPRTRHTPSEGSALGACLPACLPGPHCCSPGPNQGCCRSFSRSRREPAGQPILRDYSGGKNQRRQEGRARWPRPSSGQAGQSSPTGTAPASLKPPSQALSAQRARRSPLAEGSRWGASRKSTAAEGFQAEWTALGLEGYRQELGY